MIADGLRIDDQSCYWMILNLTNLPSIRAGGLFAGYTPGAIRTHNLCFRRASLYPIELPGCGEIIAFDQASDKEAAFVSTGWPLRGPTEDRAG